MNDMIAVLLAIFSFALQWAHGVTEQPNIIFILADDLGYFDVGYREGSIVKTPNIDKLAAEGVKLERYYAQSSCMPSRSCLMMGRYQIHTGFDYRCLDGQLTRLCMAPDTVTLPMKLRQYGYATHMIGKWHLGHERKECVPTHKGFDTFFGYHGAAENYYTHTALGRPRCHDLWRNMENVAEDYDGQYSTLFYTKEAQDIIKNHDKKKPFFMYLSYQAVHGPLEVPSNYRMPYYTSGVDESRQIYAAMATCMDEGIGNITETLKASGMLNNTILVFSSDNGAQFHTGGRNWPLRGGKGTMWEGGVRVLAFVNSPLLKKSRTVNHEMIHTSDWFPTFVRLAGGTVDDVELDGVDQWDTISTGAPTKRQELLIQISGRRGALEDIGKDPWITNDYFDITRAASIIVGRWKLVTGQYRSPKTWVPPPELNYPEDHIMPPSTEILGKMVWLFDLEEDQNEKNDLSSCRPEIVIKLLKRLRDYYSHSVFCGSSSYSPNCAQRGNQWGPYDL